MTQAIESPKNPGRFSRQTLGAFLKTWLEDHKRPTLAPGTYAGYEAIMQKHLLPELGKIPLAKLTPQHIDSYLNKKRQQKLSENYLLQHFAILRHALNQAGWKSCI